MNILFLTDSSNEIGIGHLMRCLSLARVFAGYGLKSKFICRKLNGNRNNLVKELGYELIELGVSTAKGSADSRSTTNTFNKSLEYELSDIDEIFQFVSKTLSPVLIIDSYNTTFEFEQNISGSCILTVVIDDLAARQHCCDIILNQNISAKHVDYFGLLPLNTKRLIGPTYSLLNPSFEFAHEEFIRRPTRVIANEPKKILLSMGGSDGKNYTMMVLREIERICKRLDVEITVLSTSANKNLGEIKEYVSENTEWCTVSLDIIDMPNFLLGFDLCIGAGGVSALERCCVGLPSIILPIAQNQIPGSYSLAKKGACVVVNNASEASVCLNKYITQANVETKLHEIAHNGVGLVDGRGCKRVAEIIINAFKNLC